MAGKPDEGSRSKDTRQRKDNDTEAAERRDKDRQHPSEFLGPLEEVDARRSEDRGSK